MDKSQLQVEMNTFKTLLEQSGAFKAGVSSAPESLHHFFLEFQNAEKAFKFRYRQNNFNLIEECSQRPSDYKVFLQSFAIPASDAMRVALIRLANHGRIISLKVEYRYNASLKIDLEFDSSPYEEALKGEPDHLVMNKQPFDYMLLARLGVAVSDQLKPLFYGPIPWAFPENSSSNS